MTTIRTQTHGNTNLLVPCLLLMLSLVAAWVFLSGPSSDTHAPESAELHQEIGQTWAQAEDLEEANLEGETAPISPTRNTLLPTIGSIRGKVHAEAWVEWPRGISVRLELQSSGQEVATHGISQEEPAFEFAQVEFGNYRLILNAPGAMEVSVLLTVSPISARQSMYLPLRPAATVYGTVKNVDGIVVSEIQVTAIMRSEKPGRYQEPLVTLTNEAGEYSINSLQPGSEYDVFVGTFGNPISMVKTVGVSKYAPKAWADFEIPLMGRAVITIDFADGAAVREKFGRVLRVMATKEGEPPGYSQSLALSENWTATFVALPPGEYSFSVYGGSFRRVIKSAGVSPKWETALTIPVRHLGKGNLQR